MPVGIIIDSVAIISGGILGALIANWVSEELKNKLNLIFGLCAFAMGIKTIPFMENMPAVILALIVGTIIGVLLHFETLVTGGAILINKCFSKIMKTYSSSISREEYMETFLTLIVLFCCSGTGIYGSIVSGMTGDHSILIAKSVLDFFTAVIFACLLGPSVSFVAIPQFIIFYALFLLAGVIYPHTTPAMIADFSACGGALLFAIGFRMIKVKMFPATEMIPALTIVMPASWLWTNVVIPLF